MTRWTWRCLYCGLNGIDPDQLARHLNQEHPMTTDTAVTHEDLLAATASAMRDAAGQYPRLDRAQRRAVLNATAGYLADLRAAGVDITSPPVALAAAWMHGQTNTNGATR